MHHDSADRADLLGLGPPGVGVGGVDLLDDSGDRTTFSASGSSPLAEGLTDRLRSCGQTIVCPTAWEHRRSAAVPIAAIAVLRPPIKAVFLCAMHTLM